MFSSQSDALKMFLDKFASKIIPEYMSQRDFLLSVANDAFLSQENFVFNILYILFIYYYLNWNKNDYDVIIVDAWSRGAELIFNWLRRQSKIGTYESAAWSGATLGHIHSRNLTYLNSICGASHRVAVSKSSLQIR